MNDLTAAAAEPPTHDSPGVVAPPPLVYLCGLTIGFALEAVLPSAHVPSLAEWVLGCALLVAGGALAYSFLTTFRRAGTPVDPGESARTLVTGGPYRLTRNPGYLGMALAYAGIAVASGALWLFVPLVPVLAVIDRGVIAREERYLARKFGAEYTDYRARVRRWL